MSENMKKFLELISKDENLKKKMAELEKMESDKAIREIIALAKEHGIELSEADFVKAESDDELSDDELDAVAGGGSWETPYYIPDGCAVFGAGGIWDIRR